MERTGNRELLEDEEEEREQKTGSREGRDKAENMRNGGCALKIEHHVRWCA